MITKQEYKKRVQEVCRIFGEAGIALTDEEKGRIEVADFGLNDLEHIGLQLLTYVNTERVCAKEMVLFPFQTCPEHRHPERKEINGNIISGKEETFRCRKGKVYVYVEGEKNGFHGIVPPTDVTVWHEIALSAGEQYLIKPNTLHWFQAGKEGAVISEFSTHSDDASDIFTDCKIDRTPKVAD